MRAKGDQYLPLERLPFYVIVTNKLDDLLLGFAAVPVDWCESWERKDEGLVEKFLLSDFILAVALKRARTNPTTSLSEMLMS